MKKLTKKDVLWLFAMKDGLTKEHYEKYYGVYDGQPTDETLLSITRCIIDKVDGWKEIINMLMMDRYSLRMFHKSDILRKQGKEDEARRMGIVIEKEYEPWLEQWLWKGIKTFAIHREVKWFDKHAPKDWEKWVDEERKYWDNIIESRSSQK